LRTQHVRAVVVDEAQHLMQGSQAATALDQLDWIKSMTKVPGGLHILLGTYSLVHFCTVNGQTARRGLEIHFPRSHFRAEADCQACRNVLLTLLAQVPLAVDRAAILPHWQYVYARSLGCVGVLKEWLVRATALALREGSDALTLAHLERRALSDAKCARMAADIQEGEQALHSSEAHRQRLLAVLGMSELPSLSGGMATPMPPAEMVPAGSRVAPPHPPARPRGGQRRPQRDPGGDHGPARTAHEMPRIGRAGCGRAPSHAIGDRAGRVPRVWCGAHREAHGAARRLAGACSPENAPHPQGRAMEQRRDGMGTLPARRGGLGERPVRRQAMATQRLS